MPIFELNGETYNIPDNIVDQFKKDNPEATETKKPGKTTPTSPGAGVEENAAPQIQATVTESPLVDISLDLPQTGTVDSTIDLQPKDDRAGFLGSIALSPSKIPANIQKQEIGLRDMALLTIDRWINPELSREERVAKLNEYFNSEDDPTAGYPGLGIIRTADTKQEAENVVKEIRDKQLKTESQSISESIVKGNVVDAAFLAADGLIQTLPSIAFSAYGAGGIVAHGALIAGEKFNDEYLKNPKASESAIIANALGTGAIQAGADFLFRGLMKTTGVLAKEGSATQAKKFLSNSISRVAAKYLAIPAEGLVEVSQDLATKGLDDLTFGRDFYKNINKYELIDNFLLGTLMQGGVTVTSYMGNANKDQRAYAEGLLMPENIKPQLASYAENYSKIANQINKEQNPNVKEILKNQLLDIEGKISTLRRKYKTSLYAMNSNELTEYAKNKDLIEKYKSSIDKASTQESRRVIFKEIDKLNKANAEILKDATTRKFQETTAKAGAAAKKLGVEFNVIESSQQFDEYVKLKGADSTQIYSKDDGTILQYPDGKQEIIINQETALKERSVNVASHELLHAVLFRTLQNKDGAAKNLADALTEEIAKIDINKVTNSDIANRLRNYADMTEATQYEEVLTLFSDAIATGDIKFDESIFTKIGNVTKKLFKGFNDDIKFDSGRDVYNFIKNFNNSVDEGIVKGAVQGFKGRLVETISKPDKKTQDIKKSISGNKIQQIFDEKGKDGTFEIIEAYKPLTTKLTNKYRNVPGFDFELLQSEIEIGKRGLLDLINAYDSSKGATLNTYIQGQLANRSIEAANRILDTEFKLDVTEAKGVTDTVTAEETIEREEAAPADEIKSLRKEIGLSEELVTKVKDAVVKTFGTKLPNPQDPKFRFELQKRFRTELKKPLSKFVGKQADYEAFLRDNFESVYSKMPQSLINRRFKEFAEPVLDKNGKQVREKTAEGNKVYVKKKISKAEWVKYFIGADVKSSTKGARKTAIVEGMAEEIAFDATMEVLNDPDVISKYQDIAGITSEVLPENFKSLIAKQVDRAEDFKFSKSLINDANVKYSLTQQELGRILFENTMTELANEFPELADSINNENFKKSYPKVFYTIVVPAFEKAINKSIEEGGIQQAEQVVVSFIKTFSRGTRTFSTKKGELNLTTNKALWENVIYPAIKGTGLSSKKKFNLLKSGDRSYIRYADNPVVALIDVTNKNTRNDILSGKISKEEVNIQNEKALSELKNIIFNIGRMHPGLALSIIKVNQKDQRTLFRNAARLNRIVQNYKGDTVYEHNPPVQYIFNKIVDYLSNPNKNKKENLINLLNTMEANLVPKDFAQIVDKKFKDKMPPEGVFRYAEAQAETNYTFSEGQFKFSKSLNKEFNKILEQSTGIDWARRFSPVEARVMSKGKGKKFFIPYSADDFVGLLYATLGTKEQGGNEQMEWYKENLLRPFSRGIQQYEAAKQNALRQWQILKKEAKKDVPGGLDKKNATGLSNQDAVRIYIWSTQGMDIPGTEGSPELVQQNLEIVKADEKLKAFADRLMALNPEGYPEPSDNWDSGDITTDIVSYINGVKRSEFLTEWKENADEIFSDQNKEKLKALYGDTYIEALEDILHRMRTGTNRKFGVSKIERQFMDWTNNSVGAIMFFNARSAVLQTLSAVNFINFSDNNPINAGIAFANQRQYWNDFSTLFNSDFLKQRRTGLQTDVNADEIARAAKTSTNKARAALSALLKFGFTPTQIADSFAIASGGATFYRNRINKYLKEGLEQKEAEQKAFTDFQEIAEETQQSARPDRISLQQASSLGRLVLAFGNTPMQYARLTKKATLDLINGRGDWKTNISKIAYYSVIQNIIFSALQQGLFALLFDDEDDDKEKSRLIRIGNSSADTLLRGLGVYGAAAATVKNMILKIIEESKKSRSDYTKVAIEATAISPPINSKLRKLISAGKTFTYKQSKEKVFTEGISLENPAFLAGGKVLSAATNLPADRVVQKLDHLKTAMESETELWQSIALSLGWSEWDLNMIEKQSKKAKDPLKAIKRIERKIKKY